MYPTLDPMLPFKGLKSLSHCIFAGHKGRRVIEVRRVKNDIAHKIFLNPRSFFLLLLGFKFGIYCFFIVLKVSALVALELIELVHSVRARPSKGNFELRGI